ncbi:MAG: DUF5343 domain-containing protein [Patescibacteria group bacterium]|nr:DUF5343 domain-containing protein [Patescibacteria group bacterium]
MISEAYMNSVGRLPAMLEAIQSAGVPPRFTIEFLKSLGFKSTNDRAFIPVLKGIKFLDESGVPTEKYKAYKNKSEGGKVLARALKLAYEDLFLADENVQDASQTKIAGIFATKTGKGETVTKKMATTFKALADKADFSDKNDSPEEHVEESMSPVKDITLSKKDTQFHYNIQIHLPATKDISVYNAIFKSLKEYLL